MHDALVRQFADIRSPECAAGGCALQLDGLPRVIVLRFESYCERRNIQGERCDFLVFVCRQVASVLAVEIKSGKNVEAKKAARQLQQASSHLPHLINELGDGPYRYLFYPVLVCASVKHANELKVLRRERIDHGGKRYPIIYRKCGTHIRDILCEIAPD